MTWVLLRGLAREARHWGDFPQRLRARLPSGDEVIALDLPGNGSRWRERSPATVAGMVAAARAQVGDRGPCVLVALSLGGMVALEWAASAPAEVAGCVLINSSLGAFSPFWQRLRPGCYGPLLRALLPGPPDERERTIYRVTSNLPVRGDVLAQWVAYAQSHPVAARNVLRQLVAAARFRAPPQPSVPVLVLASRGDRLVDADCSRALARTWGLPLREHLAAGHDLPLDDPGWIAEQVRTWWSQCAA